MPPQVGELFYFAAKDRGFRHVMLAGADGAVIGGEDRAAAAAFGDLFTDNFAFADEFRCKPCGTSAFKGGSAKYKAVAAVLDDDLGFGVTVGAGDLGHRWPHFCGPTVTVTRPNNRPISLMLHRRYRKWNSLPCRHPHLISAPESTSVR
jgi:hypothetical protein